MGVSVHRHGDVGVDSAGNGCPGCRSRPVGSAVSARAPHGPRPLRQGRAIPGACARAPKRLVALVLDGDPYDLEVVGSSPALCSPADSRKRPARSPVALSSTNLPIIVGSSFVPAHGLPRCPHQGRRPCRVDGPLTRRTPAPADRPRPQPPGTVSPPTGLRQAQGLLARW